MPHRRARTATLYRFQPDAPSTKSDYIGQHNRNHVRASKCLAEYFVAKRNFVGVANPAIWTQHGQWAKFFAGAGHVEILQLLLGIFLEIRTEALSLTDSAASRCRSTFSQGNHGTAFAWYNGLSGFQSNLLGWPGYARRSTYIASILAATYGPRLEPTGPSEAITHWHRRRSQAISMPVLGHGA